jgi:REP element-mobilizing transposase RayT
MQAVERRKRLRLAEFDYATSGTYFVTVCARDRRCIFGRIEEDRMLLSRLGHIVEGALRGISDFHPGVGLDASIVMPNHVHAVVVLDRDQFRPPAVPAVIGAFKARASRRAGRALWQRSYFDRVVRSERELAAYRGYIETNPLRWAIDRENPERHLPARFPGAG